MPFRTIVSLLAASFVVALAALPAAAASSVSVTNATLSNGLRVVVLRDRLAPAVTTWLNVEAGSDDEPYTGLAHAQEHMFFRGSATLSGAAADQIAGFTGDQDNADTQSEVTQYFHFVPSSDLELALQLDRNRFHGILDAQTDWSEERGAIEQEVTRDNSDATYRLYVKLLHHIMAGTPYADEGLGTLHSFGKQINSPQLKAFYNTWYHPNNAIYVIAGDVDPQSTIAAVRRYLGGLPSVPVPAHKPAHVLPMTPVRYADTSDQSSTLAMVAYKYPGYADPDYAASVILADVLNSQRGALYGLVASGKAQAVEADANQWPEGGFVTLVSHVAVSTRPAAAVADLESVVAKYRTSGIPDELVEAAKKREIVRQETASSSVLNLAAGWSQTLAVEHRTPDDDIALIGRVTAAQVNALLRKDFIAATADIAYAVPKSGGSASDAGTGGGEENAKKPPKTITKLPPWAESALAHLSPPERTIAPTTFRLSNGLRVIVQPETASPSVSIAGAVAHDAGLEEPAGQDGVQSVLEALLPYGTKKYSRTGYQAQIDAISGNVTNGYAFTLSAPSAAFDRGMQLLAEDELHPALDSTSFEIVKAERIDALTGDATNPDHVAAVASANALYPPSDPARRFATADSVKTLTLDDVKAAYALSFRPDLTTIAIVGNVTPNAARASAERWFGSWRAAGGRPVVDPRVVPNNQPAASNVPATGRLQDTVLLDETVPIALSDPDAASLEIANAVLSGDFSSILIRDMRVTTGYVYYVGTTLDAGNKRSVFSVRYGCAPENFSKAEAVLERDLSRMQTVSLPRELVERAKSHLVSETTLLGASYDGLAQRLLFNVSHGFRADYDYVRARQELAATPLTVRYAMARWIRPDGFVRIVEGPAPR